MKTQLRALFLNRETTQTAGKWDSLLANAVRTAFIPDSFLANWGKGPLLGNRAIANAFASASQRRAVMAKLRGGGQRRGTGNPNQVNAVANPGGRPNQATSVAGTSGGFNASIGEETRKWIADTETSKAQEAEVLYRVENGKAVPIKKPGDTTLNRREQFIVDNYRVKDGEYVYTGPRNAKGEQPWPFITQEGNVIFRYTNTPQNVAKIAADANLVVPQMINRVPPSLHFLANARKPLTDAQKRLLWATGGRGRGSGGTPQLSTPRPGQIPPQSGAIGVLGAPGYAPGMTWDHDNSRWAMPQQPAAIRPTPAYGMPTGNYYQTIQRPGMSQPMPADWVRAQETKQRQLEGFRAQDAKAAAWKKKLNDNYEANGLPRQYDPLEPRPNDPQAAARASLAATRAAADNSIKAQVYRDAASGPPVYNQFTGQRIYYNRTNLESAIANAARPLSDEQRRAIFAKGRGGSGGGGGAAGAGLPKAQMTQLKRLLPGQGGQPGQPVYGIQPIQPGDPWVGTQGRHPTSASAIAELTMSGARQGADLALRQYGQNSAQYIQALNRLQSAERAYSAAEKQSPTKFDPMTGQYLGAGAYSGGRLSGSESPPARLPGGGLQPRIPGGGAGVLGAPGYANSMIWDHANSRWVNPGTSPGGGYQPRPQPPQYTLPVEPPQQEPQPPPAPAPEPVAPPPEWQPTPQPGSGAGAIGTPPPPTAPPPPVQPPTAPPATPLPPPPPTAPEPDPVEDVEPTPEPGSGPLWSIPGPIDPALPMKKKTPPVGPKTEKAQAANTRRITPEVMKKAFANYL